MPTLLEFKDPPKPTAIVQLDAATLTIPETGEHVRFRIVRKWCGDFWTCDTKNQLFAQTRTDAYAMTPEGRRDTVGYED